MYQEITIKELKRALDAKRSGTYQALPGWHFEGKPIAAVKINRSNGVYYYDAAGNLTAAFSGCAVLDD